jgi:UDP-N-acetylglucosamine transferase subunit ALG13
LIFVVLGTHELPFTRLLEAIDEQIELGNINEEVIVQVGHTRYRSDNMKFIKFTTYEEMERLYREARFIITHGGTGSITMGVKMGKKVIAVPRLLKYGEHNDDHQLEIVKQFYELGHILYWDEHLDLADVLKKVNDFQPRPFISSRTRIIKLIEDFIENLG